MDARVVVCGGEKGGTGKTMLAVHLAVWLSCYKQARVKLCDLDPQGSAARWARERERALRVPKIPYLAGGEAQFGSVYAALKWELEQGYLLVVDVGGADSAEFHEVLGLADVLVCPTTPGDCDLATLGLVNELVAFTRQAQKKIAAHVVLNLCANDWGQEVREAHKELAPLTALSIAQSTIRFRKGFRTAYRNRMTMGESADEAPKYENKKRYAEGAREIEALFEELFA